MRLAGLCPGVRKELEYLSTIFLQLVGDGVPLYARRRDAKVAGMAGPHVAARGFPLLVLVGVSTAATSSSTTLASLWVPEQPRSPEDWQPISYLQQLQEEAQRWVQLRTREEPFGERRFVQRLMRGPIGVRVGGLCR